MAVMLHPLEQKLVALRRRARRMEAVYTLSIATTTLLAALVAFGAIDYLLRFQDRGLRIIASLSALGVLGWVAYRLVRSSLFTALGDLDLALRAERFFPNLKNRLASAVEFLHESEDDPVAGSATLRRAVIAQTAAETQDVDFCHVLDPRPTMRAAAILLAACLLAGFLAVLAPSVAQTAVVRLVNPFGNTVWPQTTHLVVRRPVEQVARGQDFQIEVVDARGIRLPPEVRIHYRLPTPDGGTVEEAERMRFADGTMVARRENVLRPFSYRVEGGDDQSSIPWSPVEVVEPPAVESISIRLLPPPYTGKPPVPSERNIRALVGTRVQVTGKSTKPLASASLCLEAGRKVPVQLAADGSTFSVTNVVEKSGAYWFDLTDREGLHGGSDDRWEILAVPDASPAVHIEKPNANLYVTPAAVVPIRVSAQDDLALRDLTLVFRLAETAPEKSLSLFSGPPQPSEPNAAGDSRVVNYRWNLAPLNLRPGAQVTFYATASDYLPQKGKSDPRRLIVVTPDDLQDRIADRETLIVAELDRALKMQRDCREQVNSLRARLSELRRFERSDVDRLQAAEHSQRDVNHVLTSRGEGVPMHVLALLADLENNGIDNAEARQRITSLLAELDRLDRELIPPIGRDMTAAIKTAQVDREGQGGDAEAVGSVAKSLVAVARRQDSIVASLERRIGQLARWDGYRRLHREIGQLIRDQDEAARRTSEVGRRTLTRDLRDLSPQDAANLKLAAARQLELARLLDRLLQEADQSSGDLRKTDPLAAETVANALDEARRLAISGQMRTAAGQIQENQIGQAAAAQKQILQYLREVLDILAHQRQNDLAGLVKKLREAQSDLAALEQRQDDLRKQFDAAAKDKNKETLARELERLARSQRQLREEAERLARQLAQLQADKAAQAAGLAARQMDEAAQQAGQGDGAAASRQAADALRSLADARRQLADQLGQATARLTTEQVAQLEDNVKHLRRQQESALDEAQRLRSLEESQGQLTRSQALSLRELARLQRSLQTDTARLAGRLSGAGAFELALIGVAADMGRAADSLDRRQNGPPTHDAQRRAIRQLDHLLDRLIQQARKTSGQSQSDTSQSQQDTRSTSTGSPPEDSGPPGNQQPSNHPSTTGSARPPDKPAVRKSDAAATQAIMKRLWGTLPERQREQMLQSPIEEFPPKYEQQIEDYFRRLSEEKRGE